MRWGNNLVAVDVSNFIYLFLKGQYTHILRQIFLYLDGTSLKCAELVCWSWRRFVLEEIWENVECSKLVEKGWKKGIPATRWFHALTITTILTNIFRRLELVTNCVSMVVDERSIVCGLEDGRVDVYSRASVQRYPKKLGSHFQKMCYSFEDLYYWSTNN